MRAFLSRPGAIVFKPVMYQNISAFIGDYMPVETSFLSAVEKVRKPVMLLAK